MSTERFYVDTHTLTFPSGKTRQAWAVYDRSRNRVARCVDANGATRLLRSIRDEQMDVELLVWRDLATGDVIEYTPEATPDLPITEGVTNAHD